MAEYRHGRLEWPAEWPPAGLAAEAPLALLGRAYGELRAEFSVREPDSPTPTWFAADQTVAFWIRRMAQETVVHRIDAELAAGLPVTAVPEDLAIDGIDEVLNRMLAFGSVAWPVRSPRSRATIFPAAEPARAQRLHRLRAAAAADRARHCRGALVVPAGCYLTWRPAARLRADGSRRVRAGVRSRNSAYVSGAWSDSARP